jgi:hypothetical protein
MEKMSCLNCNHNEVCSHFENLDAFLSKNMTEIQKMGWFFEVAGGLCKHWQEKHDDGS